jgi:LysM repeat protein
MNTPSPFVPQGTSPSKGKSSLYFKVLMILALHVAVFGGILMQGCKDTTKQDNGTSGTAPDTSSTTSNAPDVGPVTSNSTISNTVTSQLPPQPMTTTSAPPTLQPPTTLPPVNNPPVAAPTTTEGTDYVIVHGDTLGAIAKHHGISVRALLEANPGVNPKKLKVGQKIQIPGSTGGVATSTTGATESGATGDTILYTVKSGDALGRIARSHHTTVKAIEALNDMKSSAIRAGQKIKLPAPSAPAENTAPSSTIPTQPAPVNNAPTAPPATAPNQ